jgi:His-Xaa-Ser system radical SAM maturase HxsB
MISKDKIDYAKLGNFRFRKIGESILLTNDSGDWMFASEKIFGKFLAGKIKKESEEYKEFQEKGFIKPNKEIITKLAGKYLSLNSSVAQGTSLFIFVVTLRCNHRCLYCQVTPESPEKKGFDMSIATAKRAVDLAFETPSPFLRIEFQGGEPLLNWPILKFIIKYSKDVNKNKKKNLKISLVSNLILMDKKKLKFLLDEDINLNCSFDGPAKVHDKNRIYLKGKSSYAIVAQKIKEIAKEKEKKDKKPGSGSPDIFNGILTVSKFSLPFHKEIIDEYIKMGFSRIALRPLHPFGLEKNVTDIIAYSTEEFVDFYKKALDYILEINRKGTLLIEINTRFVLKKVLLNMDANHSDLRSPCGAAIGQMAFNYDGGIYACDEGRMASRMGYENFKLGELGKSRMKDVIDNETVKTMCLSSCLDSHTGCQNCVYKAYCGTCVVANFLEYGTIFPQITNTDKCKINKAIFDHVFLRIGNKQDRKVFESWIK